MENVNAAPTAEMMFRAFAVPFVRRHELLPFVDHEGGFGNLDHKSVALDADRAIARRKLDRIKGDRESNGAAVARTSVRSGQGQSFQGPGTAL